MSTILFKEDKQLVLTKNTKIRQGESRVDVLEVLIPLVINDLSMEGFTATLLYVDAANVSHMETLTLSGDTEDGLYKDSWYRYVLPVDSKFTYMAGRVKFEITLTKYDVETETSYVMHSSELEFNILTWEDYYRFTPESSIGAMDTRFLEIDNEIAKLNSIADIYSKAQAVDLMLTDDKLQLKDKNDEPMGDGVEILVEYNIDTDSKPRDSSVDLDEIDGPGGGGGGGDDSGDSSISELDLDSLLGS